MTETNLPPYQKGLHLLCEAHTDGPAPLTNFNELKSKWTEWIAELELQAIGEVFHDFPGGGFTGVICLTESHISIHTWPEYNYFTFDVFLSNYQQVNDVKGEEMLKRTLELLQAKDNHITKIQR